MRTSYQNLYKGYRLIKPNIDIFDSFHTYEQADKQKSRLPKKINWVRATPLCEIMKRKETDKALYQGVGRHNYTFFYDAAFRQFINKPIRVFEMGIGSVNIDIGYNMGMGGVPGASLRGWKSYFPKAQIFSADIDKDILFQEDRISTFYVDQLDPALVKAMWESHDVLAAPFDIIIDDGLHTYGANRCFFENSIHKLTSGGIYIVEDVERGELPRWREIILNQYMKQYPHLRFLILDLPNIYVRHDNILIIVESIQF